MRLSKLLLCALLICALAIPAGFANGEDIPETQVSETPVPATPVPETPPPAEENPTQAPADTPAAEATVGPTSAPTQEPGAEISAEPTAEPTLEPTIAPTQDPDSEPTAEPTVEPTAEPTPEPSVSPSVSPEPTAAPLPLPGTIDGLVKITPEGEASLEGNVWRISIAMPDSPLAFTWSVDAEAAGYLVYVQTSPEEMRLIAETDQARIELSPANYANGQYTLYVGAALADGSTTWGSIVFELAGQQGGFPGGGFPGGVRPGGGQNPGQLLQGEQGFGIIPGEALTSKHANGIMDATAYTHSEIIASDEAISALTLSSTQTEITLDDGAGFFASVQDGKLQLRPETEGREWRLSVLAMNTLADSGIECVVFHLDGISRSMPARMELRGSVYASLRANGYVSKDMEICIAAQGVRVHAAGGIYSIDENGELIPSEE